MQAFVVAAADHQTAGELVHDDDLTILDHIVDILLHHAVSLDGLIDVVGQGHILSSGQVLDLEVFLGLLDALGSQGAGLVLFIHDIIAVGPLIGLPLIFQLDHHTLVQGADEAVHLGVQAGGCLLYTSLPLRQRPQVEKVHLRPVPPRRKQRRGKLS